MFPAHLGASELALIARAIWTWDEPLALGLVDELGMTELRTMLARHHADMLASTNANFDRARFLRAATTGVNAPTRGAPR